MSNSKLEEWKKRHSTKKAESEPSALEQWKQRHTPQGANTETEQSALEKWKQRHSTPSSEGVAVAAPVKSTNTSKLAEIDLEYAKNNPKLPYKESEGTGFDFRSNAAKVGVPSQMTDEQLGNALSKAIGLSAIRHVDESEKKYLGFNYDEMKKLSDEMEADVAYLDELFKERNDYSNATDEEINTAIEQNKGNLLKDIFSTGGERYVSDTQINAPRQEKYAREVLNVYNSFDDELKNDIILAGAYKSEFQANPDVYEKYAVYEKDYEKAYNKLVELGYTDAEAKELISYGSMLYNEKQNKKLQTEIANASSGELALKNIKAIPNNLTSGIGQLDITLQTLRNRYTGNYRPVDYYTPSTEGGRYSREVIKETSERIENPVVDFIYNTGMSIANSATSAAVGGQFLAPIILSGSAGLNTIYDAKERGLSDIQAVNLGLAASLNEALFEKISIDKFFEGLNNKEAKKFIVQIFTQSVPNGLEEVGTSLANQWADTIIAADKSQFNADVSKYMQDGKTEEEAKALAARDFFMSLGLDFLGGFLSGVVFGTVQAVANKVSSKGNTQAETPKIEATANEEQEGGISTTPEANEAKTLEKAASDIIKEKASSAPVISRLEAMSSEGKQISAEDVEKATGFGKYGSEAVAKAVNENKGSFVTISDEMRVYYEAGRANVKANPTTDIQTNAYTAGKQDRELGRMKAVEGISDNKVFGYKESGLITPESENKGNFNPVAVPKSVSQGMVKALDYIGKATGRKVMFVDDITASNGTSKADASVDNNGVFKISVNAKKQLHKLVLHEPVHIMQQEYTQEYQDFADFALENAELLGYRLELENGTGTAFERLYSTYEARGLKADADLIVGEVVARFAEKLANNDQEAISLIEKANETPKSRNAIQRFFDLLRKWIEKLKNLSGNLKSIGEYSAAKQIDNTVVDIEKGRELYAKAFKATAQAAQERAKQPKSKASAEVEAIADAHTDLYNLAAEETHKKSLESKYNEKSADIAYGALIQRYDAVLDIWKQLGGELDSLFLNEWNAKSGKDRAFTLFKAQTGYKYNIELSTMCKKAVPLFEAIDTIVKKEASKRLKINVISKQEKDILYGILKSKGFEIPCAICYVEQARQREGAIINTFCDGRESTGKLGWNSVLDSIESKMKERGVDFAFPSLDRSVATDKYSVKAIEMSAKEQEAFYESLVEIANDEIAKSNETSKTRRNKITSVQPSAVNTILKGSLNENLTLIKVMFNNPDSRFRIENDLLYSSETTMNLAYYHQPLYKLFNMQGGTAGYKTKQKPIVYWGDILETKWSPTTVKRSGGIRNQSNSDFQMYTFLDVVQMFVDYSAKGYYLQEYTKVLPKLKLFGLSNAKQNASFIPLIKNMFTDGAFDEAKTRENAGLDENGELLLDGIEGINPEEAFMLITDPDYSKSICGICIGYSDKHILKLLDDPRFQMIIGFHDKTNNPQKRYQGAKYAKNYKGINEAKRKSDGKTVHLSFSTFLEEAEKEFRYNKSTGEFEGTTAINGKEYTANDIPKLAADLYLSHCEAKAFFPAYSQGETDFSKHENYYKLLADFGLYDSQGNYAPQRKVTFKMPGKVPYLDADGNKKYMPAKEYIKQEIQKEVALMDSLAEAMADTSEDGIISQFESKVNAEAAEEDFDNYSLQDDIDISTEDTKKMLDTIASLKREFEITKFAKADPNKLEAMTKKLLKDYDSKADTDETTKAIDKLYEYIANGEDGEPPAWNEVYNKAYEISKNIVENAVVTDDYDYQTYKSLRQYLRTTPMKFDSRYDEVPAAYESFNDFRKKNMGRLRFTNDGIGIDSVYAELANQYPDFFDAEEEVATSDILGRIVDVLDSIQPTEVNPFSADMKEATANVANDIIDRFFEVPQAKPTFADKAERRVLDARIAGQKKVEKIREQRDEKIRKLIESQREKTKAILQKAREDKAKAVAVTRQKGNTRVSKLRESQKAKALRAKIIRHASDLSQKLVRGTDNKHIPKDLQGAVAMLLESINLESSYALVPHANPYVPNEITNKSELFKTYAVARLDVEKAKPLGVKRDTIYQARADIIHYAQSHDDLAQTVGVPLKELEQKLKLWERILMGRNVKRDKIPEGYGTPTKRTQAFEKLRELYGEIASTTVIDPDLLGEDGLLSDVIKMRDKRIADMNSKELEVVWKTMRAIEASVNNANKLFSQSRFAAISEVAEKLRIDNRGKETKKEFRGLAGRGQKLITIDMLTPETYFHFLGESGDSIFRMMRDAQDKHVEIMKEVADFTRKTLKGVNVNKLEKTLHTVKLGDENVKLTTAQLMELYVLMNRKQAVDHILVGGILPDEIEKGVLKNNRPEPIRNITQSEIDEALTKLSAEEKAIADKLQNFVSTVLSAYGNEASMKVYNYEKFLEKNYWTIRTNKQEIASDIGKDTAVTSVANKGMAKSTKPNANTSVRIGSIFDTFSAHSSDMATYAAWLGTSEDVNRIRNFVFWKDGARTGTVKGILDTVHGAQGSAYLQKLLEDIAIGVKGAENMNPFDFVGSYKAASVGANLRVIIQQPTAILRALDMIDAKYLGASGLHPLKGWEKAKKYAPIAQWKDWGHFDINTGRQMKDVLFDNASALEKAKQVGMWGASMADSLSWGVLWNAVEAETKATRKELKVGSDEYYNVVSKRFTEVVDHTQVVDGILQRSQAMRNPDALAKMATSFLGEPTKQYNMAMYAGYDAITSRGESRKKAINRLGRSALSLAVAGLINACAQSFVDALRDDDKEKKYWEKWLSAFWGDDEDAWFQKGGNLADSFNPLSFIPYVKDIVSIFEGYEAKRMDVESISKLISSVQNMHKAVLGEGKYTFTSAFAALAADIARLYGLPVANIKRDIMAAVTTFAVETDNYLLQYRLEKASLNMTYSRNSKNFMDILYKAYVNDKEAYQYIYSDMIKSGYTASQIKSGLNSRK